MGGTKFLGGPGPPWPPIDLPLPIPANSAYNTVIEEGHRPKYHVYDQKKSKSEPMYMKHSFNIEYE